MKTCHISAFLNCLINLGCHFNENKMLEVTQYVREKNPNIKKITKNIHSKETLDKPQITASNSLPDEF